MRKAISPVIAIILLIMMTVGSSALAFFWIGAVQSDIQESVGSSIESTTILDCSRLNIISVRGDEAVIQNVGCDDISNITLFLNGQLTNYDLSEPIAPGEAVTITYTAQELGEPLSVIVALNNGNTVSETISNCTNAFGCTNLEQTFEDYAVGTDLADIPSWTNIGTQDEDCYAKVELHDGDNEGHFYDFDGSNLADKIYVLPNPSSGSGNSTLFLSIDITEVDPGLTFVVVFYDESNNILQVLLIGNGYCAVVEAPSTFRSFYTQPGGGGEMVRWDNPVTYEGKNKWTFEFNEDDETIRYYINGVEIFSNDGLGGTFDSYYAPAGGLSKIEIASGVPISLGGTGVEDYVNVYVDDINVDWI